MVYLQSGIEQNQGFIRQWGSARESLEGIALIWWSGKLTEASKQIPSNCSPENVLELRLFGIKFGELT